MCFSINGPKAEDGKIKSINAVCKSEKEVDHWINDMESLIILLSMLYIS